MRIIRSSIFAVVGIVVAGSAAVNSASTFAPGSVGIQSAIVNSAGLMEPVDAALKADAEGFDASAFVDIARQSLKSDPLNPPALRTLALAQKSAGNADQSLALLRLSARVSRRDSLTQGYLIESLATGSDADVQEILSSYDKLLIVSPSLQDGLLPTLSQILMLPAGRTALSPYVRSEAPWVDKTLLLTLEQGGGADAVADALIAAFPDRKANVSARVTRGLIDHYDAAGDYASVERLFGLISNDAEFLLDPSTFRHAEQNSRYGSLVWTLPREAEAGFELLGTDTGEPALRAYSIRGADPQPARKLAFLEPGEYSIEVAVRGGIYSTLPYVDLALRCLSSEDSNVLAELRLTADSSETTSKKSDFSVDCEAVEITLDAAPMPGRDAGEIIIEPLSISKSSS